MVWWHSAGSAQSSDYTIQVRWQAGLQQDIDWTEEGHPKVQTADNTWNMERYQNQYLCTFSHTWQHQQSGGTRKGICLSSPSWWLCADISLPTGKNNQQRMQSRLALHTTLTHQCLKQSSGEGSFSTVSWLNKEWGHSPRPKPCSYFLEPQLASEFVIT